MLPTVFFAESLSEMVRTTYVKRTYPPTATVLPDEQELNDFCYTFLRSQDDYREFKQMVFHYLAKKGKLLKSTPEFQELYQRLYPELFI